MSKYKDLKKLIAKYYLELAEKTIELASSQGDLIKALEYIKKVEEIENREDCIPCLEAKKKNLLAIVRELKKVIG